MKKINHTSEAEAALQWCIQNGSVVRVSRNIHASGWTDGTLRHNRIWITETTEGDVIFEAADVGYYQWDGQGVLEFALKRR